MLHFWENKRERIIFISYMLMSAAIFFTLASINFKLIRHGILPSSFILPVFIGFTVGILFAYNKILQMRLSYISQSKSKFLSRLNHDLRTPMSAIIGYASFLNDDNTLTDKQQKHSERILHAGNHAVNMINELLDFAAIEAGKTQLSITKLSPISTMNNTIDMVSSLAAQNNITIEHVIPENHATFILADELRTTEVFTNLLSNAIKYNKKDGHIKIGYGQENGKMAIMISDTGIGFDKTQLAHLYEPFNRLGAEKSEIKGTGIGLSVARNFVEMMNGTISCMSERGKGTTFTLKFPSVKHTQAHMHQ